MRAGFFSNTGAKSKLETVPEKVPESILLRGKISYKSCLCIRNSEKHLCIKCAIQIK